MPFNDGCEFADGGRIRAWSFDFEGRDTAFRGRVTRTPDIAVALRLTFIIRCGDEAFSIDAHLGCIIAAGFASTATATRRRSFIARDVAFILQADHAFIAADFALFFSAHHVFFIANDAAVSIVVAGGATLAADLCIGTRIAPIITLAFTDTAFATDGVIVAVAGITGCFPRGFLKGRATPCVEVTALALKAAYARAYCIFASYTLSFDAAFFGGTGDTWIIRWQADVIPALFVRRTRRAEIRGIVTTIVATDLIFGTVEASTLNHRIFVVADSADADGRRSAALTSFCRIHACGIHTRLSGGTL